MVSDFRWRAVDRGSRPIGRRGFLTGASALGVAATLPGVGLLGGCGGSSLQGLAETVPEDPLAIPGGPHTVPRTDVAYPAGYVGPVASKKGPCTRGGKKATLRVVAVQDPEVGNWSANKFTKWYEKQSGVHIEWQVVASGDDTMTKVNAMIAAGDIPDAFLNVPFTPSQLYIYGQQGLFFPLQDLIRQYCPEARRQYQHYPETEKLLTAPDGNIYCFPYINDCYHCRFGNRMWMNTNWLDRLDLGMPQTLEEFEHALRRFKKTDLNGDGSEIVPLSGYLETSDQLMSNFFMGSFLYNPGDPWLFLDDGRVDIAVNKPGWREGLRYMRRLVDAGLMVKESFSQTKDQLLRRGTAAKAPVYGAVRAYQWADFMNVDDDDPNAMFREYHAVPTLRGPSGNGVSAWDHYGWLAHARFVVTAKCKNPAVAVMWADSQAELGTLLNAYCGVDPGSWRYAKPGENGLDGLQALWTTKGTWPPENGAWWDQNGVDYRSNDFRLAEVADPEAPTFEKQLYEDVKEAYYPSRVAKERQLPRLYLSAEEAVETADVGVSLTNLVRKMESEFSLGKADIDDDKQWNDYVDRIERLGVERYLEAYQGAYDAWVKAAASA